MTDTQGTLQLARDLLSRACHHHPYELAPTAGELATWIEVVEEFGRQREV